MKLQNLIGQQFGKLTVIQKIDVKKKHTYWKCQCRCGGIKEANSENLKRSLRSGYTASCGCHYKGKNNPCFTGYEEISGVFLRVIKDGAIKRKLEFWITAREIWELFIKQNRKCALSGIDLHFGKDSSSKGRRGTASLDRIDSSKGYTIDNVQWVHKEINMMKQDLSESKFITYCKLIASIH